VRRRSTAAWATPCCSGPPLSVTDADLDAMLDRLVAAVRAVLGSVLG
jgi:hypothetical protein